MANEKMIDKVKRIVENPEYIRNICTSAHIHHGKTAFTDNLLAAAGLMSESSAGDLDKGMATWQHKDEQERLMTVDSANVSMVHEYHEKEYLINLIDTPGHVDFGGNVTRAMRAVDGTIVLICAVEGIMPQTETVLKQAIKERVRPVLFINKVDRLIKELKFSPQQIQQRFADLIIKFNRLIEKMAEPQFKQSWKVDIAAGSVAFGSARENWALSFSFMQKKNIKFIDIEKAYTEMDKEQRDKWIWENAPLHEVILDMVIKHLPAPLEAQQYRIPKIWKGDKDSEFGKDLMSMNPKGKLAYVITRIIIDSKSGKELAAGRLFSGTIRQGQEVYLNNAKQKQRIQTVYIYRGIKPELMDSLPAGNILAVGGLTGSAGETVTLEPEDAFEELKHIFEPVITKSVEPVKMQDLPKIVEVLNKVSKEDPSIKIVINPETGENLMMGMGELHLEIVENRIKTEKGVEIKTSPPIVVYRESITKNSGEEFEGKSPNKHNKFYFVVEPITGELKEGLKEGRFSEGRVKKKNLDLRNSLIEHGMDSKEADQVKDIFKGCLYLDATRGQVHMIEVQEMILDMFEDVMINGPLARDPCINVKVILKDMSLHEDAIHRGPAQVYPAVREGIRGAMMQANPVIFEPLQTLLIEAPGEYTGEISKLVTSKRGQLVEINMEEDGANIKAVMPVMELFGWASELRSATEGKGVSSIVDQAFERLPGEKQDQVVQRIRQRKGLGENA
ncbi:elongation factor EF-2 [Candidatus Woesearchaeota archaeon CG10_big_fil_rev_8_21_14_0_10_32_9]|nr:MAG: elongation factor EF-2 [Candidatus Woesearchaeota archaeon CG10_big_fil_rev_8_21_14_0_10_32_9]